MKPIELEADGRRLEAVAGLVWHPLQGTGSARRREILAYAAAGEADLKLVRGEEAPHVGLASKGQGARAGQLSVAAVIADALAREGHRSVLVALRLPGQPETFVYVAVRDSVILADGDVVGSEPEISERLRGDKSFGGWDQVVCPQEWGLRDAQQRELSDFITSELLKKARCCQLQELRLDVRRLAMTAGILAALGLGSVYGWTTWQKKQALATAIAQAQRQQVEQEAAEKIRAVAAGALPAPPWPAMPSAPVFARACARAFARVGLTAGNWRLDGAACENGELSVRWVKGSEAAWVSHLRAVRPNAVIAPDGLSATVSVPVLATPSGERAEPLQDAAGLRLRYFDLASRYGMAIKVESPQPPPAPAVLPGQKAPPPAPPPPWAETAVQVTAAFDPVEVASLLDSPGLRFTRLVFAFSKDGLPQYQFTGVQYVRP
jgi:hypothetical protein